MMSQGGRRWAGSRWVHGCVGGYLQADERVLRLEEARNLLEAAAISARQAAREVLEQEEGGEEKKGGLLHEAGKVREGGSQPPLT